MSCGAVPPPTTFLLCLSQLYNVLFPLSIRFSTFFAFSPHTKPGAAQYLFGGAADLGKKRLCKCKIKKEPLRRSFLFFNISPTGLLYQPSLTIVIVHEPLPPRSAALCPAGVYMSTLPLRLRLLPPRSATRYSVPSISIIEPSGSQLQAT